MITLDEQIEFVDHAAQSWAKCAQSGDGFTMSGERFAASRLAMLSAILATLRSVKQAELRYTHDDLLRAHRSGYNDGKNDTLDRIDAAPAAPQSLGREG